jgi:CubicO group peptidase (beta-lactamase class C family)
VLAVTAGSSYAQLLEIAAPESVGFSSVGLEAVTANLQEHVDNGDIAGVVAAVARDGKIVYYKALGLSDIEQVAPMREDALFRIYSMTREITSVAVLQLYEQGKFKMDEPIQKYLPEFATQRVLMDSESTDVSQTRERVGDITAAQLLTHTSGLGSRSSSLYREQRVRDKNYTLDEMVKKAASVPLFHNPGTEFRYGIHATILGKLIEVWSGVPLNEYLQEQIFEPLAMGDTMFWADGENANRLVELYRPTDGRLLPYQIETVPWTMRPRLMEGGVGLLSSVMDFMHFSQMVLNKGVLGGNRILEEDTAELMYQNAVPDQAMPIGDRGYWSGSGWTLGGFNLVMDPDTYSYPVSEGTIWWDGSAGTRYFIDPVQNTVTVIMAQVSPSRGGGFREDFTRLVEAAIVERR